jgi:hypothetical protein
VYILVQKIVLLYSKGNLLDLSVRNLISSDQDLRLTVLNSVGFEELIETSSRLRPDVIVLPQGALAENSGLLNRLLKSSPQNSQIITLDDEQNIFHVYSRHEVTIQQSSDLMQVIRS